ncbi:hypothetical protein LX83_006001 [Goodfellowiella coeruleoviolacea]|uniref:Uncharacterized protein n=2 Tax=Goodfellowiella coeruleoviolacea TaxID=334858 RepID=A0AAE3KJI4_9PSEU|nr:hypothetical protein [Goodfellowiella coeruleoviolacea]
MLEFAATGRVGKVRLGMSLSEAEEILGPGRPHPAIRMLGPEASSYPYFWDHLSLFAAGGRVWQVSLNPATAVERAAFLELLRQSNVPFEPCPGQTFDTQTAIRTKAGTGVRFNQLKAFMDVTTPGCYLVGASIYDEVPRTTTRIDSGSIGD